MKNRVRVAVVDDHPLVQEGVIHAINGHDEFEVVAHGMTADDALRIAVESKPGILLLDLTIPGGGKSALQQISDRDLQTKVLILSGSDDPDDLMDALALGAAGYLLKGVTGDELIEVLRIIHQGDKFVSASLAGQVLSGLAKSQLSPDTRALENLSARELEIARMVGEGQSNKLIANALGLSEKTIKHYLTGIFRKTGVVNRVELAKKIRQETG